MCICKYCDMYNKNIIIFSSHIQMAGCITPYPQKQPMLRVCIYYYYYYYYEDIKAPVTQRDSRLHNRTAGYTTGQPVTQPDSRLRNRTAGYTTGQPVVWLTGQLLSNALSRLHNRTEPASGYVTSNVGGMARMHGLSALRDQRVYHRFNVNWNRVLDMHVGKAVHLTRV